MLSKLSGRLIDTKLSQSEKAQIPILFTDSGILTVLIDECRKVFPFITSRP